MRWTGDGTVFVDRQGKGSPPFKHLTLKDGEALSGPDFPTIYSASPAGQSHMIEKHLKKRQSLSREGGGEASKVKSFNAENTEETRRTQRKQ
jgi:hypothetical protein